MLLSMFKHKEKAMTMQRTSLSLNIFKHRDLAGPQKQHQYCLTFPLILTQEQNAIVHSRVKLSREKYIGKYKRESKIPNSDTDHLGAT